MAQQTFLYDGDSVSAKRRNFQINKNAAIIRAANLTGDVPIYTLVGVCTNCDNEEIWEPMYLCGSPVVVGPSETVLGIEIPGTYYLGDPSIADLALGTDVNVTIEYVPELSEQLRKNCEASAPCEQLSDRGILPSWL